mgnify:CR=1 FL=1
MINRLKKLICICGICVLSITTLSFATVANAEEYVDNSQEAVYTTAPAVVKLPAADFTATATLGTGR